MILSPGQTITATFEVSVNSQPAALSGAVAVLVKDGLDTSVVTSITTPATGRYVVSATLPSWPDYTAVECRLAGTYNALPAVLTKPVGTVFADARAAALAVADGRHRIDYANSTATQYDTDGTTRTVFDLYDRDGNLATTPEGAVDRRPRG